MAELRELVPRLPLPLAQLVLRALSSKSALGRHNNAFFLAEATLKLAASARIGLWIERGLTPDSELARRLQALVLPSLGHWLEFLREVSRALANLPDASELPMARVAEELSRRRPDWTNVPLLAERAEECGAVSEKVVRSASRRGVLGFFELVVAYRNEVIGHGAQRSDAFYDEFGLLFLGAMGEVLAEPCLFDHLALSHAREELGSTEDVKQVSWYSLMGPASVPTSRRAEGVVPGRLYFVGTQGAVCLHPLAVYRHDEEAGTERVGFLNKAAKKRRSTPQGDIDEIRRAEYLDYSSGQSLAGIDARPALMELLTRLQGKPVRDQQLDDISRAAEDNDSFDGAASDTELASPVQPGDLVGGKYEVEDILGGGGMGVVVSARHAVLGDRVALKILRPGVARKRDIAQRFIREGQAAARIKNDHVARVLDVGALDDGTPYLVMERLDGNDLACVLRAKGPLSPSDAASCLIQACSALAEAHAQGVIHRDLKPSNLFLARTADGEHRVKLLDFGISKFEDTLSLGMSDDSLTAESSIMGTPNYMSPEQMKSSKSVTTASDIWSLGVILFELVSGTVPFRADSFAQLCARVLSEPAPDIRDRCSEVPAGLALVIHKCLQREPKERYGSVGQLAVALAPFASPDAASLAARVARRLGESGPPAQTPPGPRHSPLRRPAILALPATLLLGAAAAALVALRTSPEESRPAVPASASRPSAVAQSTESSPPVFSSASSYPTSSQSSGAIPSVPSAPAPGSRLPVKPAPIATGSAGAATRPPVAPTRPRDLTRELVDEPPR